MKVGGDTVPCSEVVGVVRDARRQSIFEGASMQYYVPMAQQRDDDYRPAFFVRTSGSPETLSAPVQRALRDESSEVRYIGVRPLQDLIEPQLRSWSLGATLFGLFGGLALVVAAVGLYSIMSFEVTRRTRELGIRSALGASARALLTQVLGEGMRLVGLGIVLGAGVALVVAPAGAALLYHVSPREPVVYLVAGGVLLAAALLAGIIPAIRASRVDPNEALRTE
jgi:ABC-type antimicrobial peptide transport system permease subunit